MRATSVLSRPEHLAATTGLAGVLTSFVESADSGANHVCTPSQLGGKTTQLGPETGGGGDNAVGEPMRAALLDTACIASWSSAVDDAQHIGKVRDLSDVLHSATTGWKYGNGSYIGEPVLDLPSSSTGAAVGADWERLYWGPDTTARLRRTKALLDPRNVFQCPMCVGS